MSSEKKPQPVAWKYWHKGEAFIEYDPIDAEELQYIGHTVEPLYSEAAIEALRAERDEWEHRFNELVAVKDIHADKRQEQFERAEAAEARVAQLEAALEPNADTKAAYDDKFSMGVELRLGRQYENRNVRIPWDVIRQIMTTIRARALLSDGGAK